MSSGQSQSPIKGARAKRPGDGRKGPSRPTTARRNPAGLVISLALHGALLAATWLTWNRMIEMSPESHVVPVELVVAQQTNVRAEAPPPVPDKIVAPAQKMDTPPLPTFADAEPAPIPPVPQFKIIKPKPDTDQPDQPKSKKQQIADADAVLNKILAQAPTPKNAKAGPRVIQGVGNQSLATADLADALKSQIYRCWNPNVAAPNPNDVVVDFDLKLNPDGTVAGAPRLSGNLAGYNLNNIPNPYTSAAATAANRAIYQCAPYKLPAARYSDWKEINPLRFDPRELMGQ